MKEFPETLTPNNLTNLSQNYKKRLLCYCRRKVYETMISSSFNIPDNCSVSFETGEDTKDYGNLEVSFYIDKEIIEIIRKELHDLGWETSLQYNSLLFIYTKDKIPKNLITTKLLDN
jgi:hypothetical protein